MSDRTNCNDCDSPYNQRILFSCHVHVSNWLFKDGLDMFCIMYILHQNIKFRLNLTQKKVAGSCIDIFPQSKILVQCRFLLCCRLECKPTKMGQNVVIPSKRDRILCSCHVYIYFPRICLKTTMLLQFSKGLCPLALNISVFFSLKSPGACANGIKMTKILNGWYSTWILITLLVSSNSSYKNFFI